MNQSNQTNSFEKNVLNKFEREELFIKAEKLYVTGAKMDSISIYMKCLANLDVHSTFPSLPKCLRALANHYLEIEDYVKSIYFVQAERMFYESALIDTAALQQKLIDLSYHGKRVDELLSTNVNFKIVEIQKLQARLLEYGHMIRYFINQKKLEMALELAHKTVKLNRKIYGPDDAFTKESLCMVHDLEVEIRRGTTNQKEPELAINSMEYSHVPETTNYEYSIGRLLPGKPLNDLDTSNKSPYDYSSTETIAHLYEVDESSDLSQLIQKPNLQTTGRSIFSLKGVLKMALIYFVFLLCIVTLIILMYSLFPILVNVQANSHILTVNFQTFMANVNLSLQSSFLRCRKIVHSLLNFMFAYK